MRSGVLVAALALVVLAGCTPPNPAPSPTPTPTEASPTPTAAPALPDRPGAAFPGGCDDLVPRASSVAPGGAVSFVPTVLDLPAAEAASAEQAGTLRCTWAFTASGDERDELSVALHRHAGDLVPGLAGGGVGYPGGSPAQIDADESSILCSAYQERQSCQLMFVVGDYLGIVSLSVTTADDVSVASTALTGALTDTVDRLRTSDEPAGWTPPEGSWTIPIDCGALVADGSLAAGAGWSSAVVVDDPGMGVEPTSDLGGLTSCPLSDGAGEGFLAFLTAGGAWIWEDVAALPGLVEVEIDGADHAGVICDSSPASCQAVAVVGPNVVTALGSADFSTGAGPELAARLEAALRGLVAGAATLT